VTDALGMGGIVSRYGAGEAAVLALVAGADLLLQPADPRTALGRGDGSGAVRSIQKNG